MTVVNRPGWNAAQTSVVVVKMLICMFFRSVCTTVRSRGTGSEAVRALNGGDVISRIR